MSAFRLAGLLRVRVLQEELAASEAAQARRLLEGVRRRRAGILASVAGIEVGEVGSATLAAVAASRASAYTLAEQLGSMEAAAQRDAALASGAHRAARRDAQAVQRLADRFAVGQQREELRREQIAIDEIATARWGRAKAGDS